MQTPRRQNNISRDAKKTQASHSSDSSKGTVDAKSGCCRLEVTRDKDTVTLQFGSDWLLELMTLSSTSLVPFRFYGTGVASSLEDRRYPRAFEQPIQIGEDSRTDDKAGGRRRKNDYNYALAVGIDQLYAESCLGAQVRLGDLLIMHKREFTAQVLKQFKGNQLICRNQVPVPDFYNGKSGVQLQAYPLLCIYFKDKDYASKGYPRLLQVVFASMLNEALLNKGCPMEVVAREGFGSSIPASSDLGNGIRLDPGLLPLEHTATVCHVLLRLEGLLLQKATLMSSDINQLAGKMDGMGEAPLAAVDGLMETLACVQELSDKAVLAALAHPKSVKGKLPVRFKGNTCMSIQLTVPTQLPWKTKERDELDGYGSDSDDEDLEPKPNKDKFVIRKAAFVSGMGAIQMVEHVGAQYVALHPRSKPGGPLSSVPYFELDKLKPVVDVSHFNAAPNPGNAVHAEGLPPHGSRLVNTMDATNITTWEKGDHICQHILACSGEADADKLLVLEESASKHPTGGDLVYGVIRVVGRESAVKAFFQLLQANLDGDHRQTTVLDFGEHQVRRSLQANALVARNRDLAGYVNARLKGKTEEKVAK